MSDARSSLTGRTTPCGRVEAPPSMLQLASERLKVAVAVPGGDFYRGVRFDWTGFVTQVTLDEGHTFCGPESNNGTGTGGAGLCNEFDLLNPMGYDDAGPGEAFPKLGIGLLTRLDHKPYRFERPYPVSPFTIHVASGGTAEEAYLEFVVEPRECRGIAARLVKRLTVRQNVLRIDYTLSNVGRRHLSTREYNHNFVSLGGSATDPNVMLDLPGRLRTEDPVIQQSPQGWVTWTRALTEPFHAHAASLSRGSDRWQLVHRANGLGVSERCSRPWSAFALYATPLTVCPEAFLDIEVPPGAETSWSREYTFWHDETPPPAVAPTT